VAVAAQIDAEHGETPAQFGGHRLKEGEIKPHRMQQNYMRAGTADFMVECWNNHGIVLAKTGGRRRSAMIFAARVSRQHRCTIQGEDYDDNSRAPAGDGRYRSRQ
jgi:hypothetical protein